MTNLIPDDDGFTELVDPQVPRVDLVDRAANGSPGFLLMKQDAQAGLLAPDLIRDLIGKTTVAVPESPREDSVTMTGSPAAIAKLIHEAAVRAEASDQVAQERKALGASSEIPDNWTKDGSLKGDVAKEMDMDDEALDAMTALAEADGDHAGMDTDPGSPAWEAIDAATARKWLAILARAKHAVDTLAEREMLEAAAGDEDDAMKAFDLQDACCAIEYAISVLAPFAVSEQAEADCGDDMQMVGKALHGFDAAQLDTIEALAPVAKAGRVLSAANEQAIREAADSLQKVLASLPAAPVEKTANEEDDMPEQSKSQDVVSEHGAEPAMGTQQAEPKPVAGTAVTELGKADGEKPKMVAVYDKRGNLVGIVDPEKITMIEGAEADDEPEASEADAEAADDGSTAPETPDLTPEPPAEAGTPADAVPTEDDEAVTKTTTSDTLSETTQSSFLELVKSALAQHAATQTAQIATTGDAVLELVGVVETLKGQIKALEEQPAEPKVFTNGAVPPRDQMRGQDRGTAAQIDVAKAREQKERLYKAADATEQNRIAKDMQASAIDMLTAIHQRRQ